MLAKLGKHVTGLAVVAMLSMSILAVGDELNLPDIGSPADAILSQNEEARIGRAIMRDIRQSGQVVEDPLIVEYVNSVGNRVAAQASDGDVNFTFFVIDDHRINAFALPGGYIGIHTGLLEATRNEGELAGVLAHEVAHVTQRHIARAIHANSRQSILTTALMLGAVIAGVAGGDGDAFQAGAVIAQGSAAQAQINFTRSNEYEADRVGIETLANAGFNPYGMASFFEVLSRQTTTAPEDRAPEFLRTHPVTTSRIAEARNRARAYDVKPRDDSIAYGIAKVRSRVFEFDLSTAAVAHFERRPYQLQNDLERYGRLLAYLRNGDYNEALDIADYLLQKDSTVIAYHIAMGDTQMRMGDTDEALETFAKALELSPRNIPLVIAYSEWLLDLGRADEAHNILLDLLNNTPPTPDQVRLIARAASEAGESAESLYYLSEYRLMIGDLTGGIRYLQQALRLPELQEIQRIRFEARIDFIREFISEEQLRRLRSAPTS